MEDVLNHSSDSSYIDRSTLRRETKVKKTKIDTKIEPEMHSIGSHKTSKDDATMMILRYYYTLNKKIN